MHGGDGGRDESGDGEGDSDDGDGDEGREGNGESAASVERKIARSIFRSIHDRKKNLVLSPVQQRSGRLPPRPPGPLRVWELCLGTASAMAAPLWGVA